MVTYILASGYSWTGFETRLMLRVQVEGNEFVIQQLYKNGSVASEKLMTGIVAGSDEFKRLTTVQ